MKWLNRWRSKRQKIQVQKTEQERREFIYLDEVSVTSLLASHDGGIPKEFTHSENSSIKAEINGSAEAGVGPFKGKLGSRYESARSSNSQVVSKATVQTLFGRLLEVEEKALVLRSIDSADRVPVSTLRRGQLVEIEVELETADIFQLSTILSTLKELSDEYSPFKDQIGDALIDEFTTINKVIEKMMVDLIPLKCRVVDHVLVKSDEGLQLARRDFYEKIPVAERPVGESIYMVGDAHIDLFWKDVRRVLFTNARFRALCRLNNDGLSESWSPLKLANVLAKIDPLLGQKLGQFGALAVSAFSGGHAIASTADIRKAAALATFADLLAEQAEVVLSDEDRSEILVIAATQARHLTSALSSREAFKPVLDLVKKKGVSLDSVDVARLREQACGLHDLSVDGSSKVPAPRVSVPGSEAERENLLDVEIVAIYW